MGPATAYGGRAHAGRASPGVGGDGSGSAHRFPRGGPPCAADARASDARAAEARARQLADSEVQLRRDALYQAYRARIAAAGAALQNHEVVDAAHQLDAAPADLRDWEWRHLHSRLDDRSRRIVPGPGEWFTLLPGPDGIQIVRVTQASLRLTALDGSRARVIPLRPQEEVYTGRIHHGPWIAEWLGDDRLRLRDERGHACGPLTIPQLDRGSCIDLTPDRSRLAAALYEQGRGEALPSTTWLRVSVPPYVGATPAKSMS